MQTRGSLFNDDRPNLADNQRQICEQMETLLQEIELKKVSPSMNRAGFPTPVRKPQRGQPSPRGFLTPRTPTQYQTGQTRGGRSSCPPNMCFRCYEAGRLGPASRNHFAADCPYPANTRRNPQRMRVLLVPATEPGHNITPQIQEVQITDDLLQQGEQPAAPSRLT